MKPNLEKRINDVAKELQKGTRTKDIISLFCTKWHLGERTVKLYVSKARKQSIKIRGLKVKAAIKIKR